MVIFIKKKVLRKCICSEQRRTEYINTKFSCVRSSLSDKGRWAWPPCCHVFEIPDEKDQLWKKWSNVKWSIHYICMSSLWNLNTSKLKVEMCQLKQLPTPGIQLSFAWKVLREVQCLSCLRNGMKFQPKHRPQTFSGATSFCLTVVLEGHSDREKRRVIKATLEKLRFSHIQCPGIKVLRHFMCSR